MPHKPIELPLEVAKDFVRDMRAFFAAGYDTIKADGIAAGTLHSLRQHYSGKPRLTDVKAMFLQRGGLSSTNTLPREAPSFE